MRRGICYAGVLWLFGFATTFAETGMTPTQAIAAAKEAQRKANSLQGGWTATDKLIRKADRALLNGEKNASLQYAERARREAELAYKQAEHERRHWFPLPYALPK